MSPGTFRVGPGSVPRVVVLGSCNMDIVVSGGRIPRPGETVHALRVDYVCGGKGLNQAVAGARAGADVHLIGAVGADEHGATIRDLLAADGIDATGLRTVSEPTGTALVTVGHDGDNTIAVVPGANATLQRLTDDDADVIERSDVLVTQFEVPDTILAEATVVAAEHGVPVVLTPAPARPLAAALRGGVTLIVANRGEVLELSGVDDLESGIASLLELAPFVVATLGADGLIAANRDGRRLAVPARQVPVIDTTAAGDTLAGVLAARLAEGRGLADALVQATSAAALAVQRPGASNSIPYRSEVEVTTSSDDRSSGTVLDEWT